MVIGYSLLSKQAKAIYHQHEAAYYTKHQLAARMNDDYSWLGFENAMNEANYHARKARQFLFDHLAELSVSQSYEAY